MPRLSYRRQLLFSLDSILISQISLLTTTTTSSVAPSFLPTLVATLLLVSFMDSEHDDDLDENLEHQERLITFACMVLMLSTMNQTYFINERKRKFEDEETTIATLLMIRVKAHSKQYPLPRYRRPRCSIKAQTFEGWFNETDRTWLTVARMSKADFTKLLHKIGSNHIFYNNSYCPQAPPQWQLLVALANLGLAGNGGSCPIKAKLFSLAEGSVANYTKRCIHALLELESEYVRWPNADKRAEIKKRIGQNSWFQECVGFIDGTLVPLAAAPAKNKEDYYTRKSIYALNSLIICDDRRKVLYAHHGWCGSAHDQRVLKSTRFYQDISAYFSAGEYILADSGYASKENIVPVFKRTRSGGLSRAQMHFNNSISKIRIASEHCNGMLQMRFGSLHELRVDIGNSKEAQFACDWISACVVVHNFIIVDGSPMDGFGRNHGLEAIDDTHESEFRAADLESVGVQRRDALFTKFCASKGY